MFKLLLTYLVLLFGLSSPGLAADANAELYQGIIHRQLSAVTNAISNGADLNYSSSSTEPPLVFACRRRAPKNILQALINAGANLNAINASQTAPIFACLTDTPKDSNLRLLCESGADLNIRNAEGHTPLTLALHKRYPSSSTSILLNCGASPDFPAYISERKIYPLTLAVILNSAPQTIAQLLPNSSPNAVFQALTVVSVTNNQDIRLLFEQHGLLLPAE